jgi:hypothetical protein
MENQLDLFEGVILTQEQEQMVKEFIANKEKDAEEAFNYNRRLQSVLVEAGFKQGIDFKNTFETVEVTADEVTIGSYYRGNQFEAKDVTYVNTKGYITLLSKRFDKETNKVVDRGISYLTLERDGKIECSTLVGSYRKVKPTTLLEKLREQRMGAETEKTHYNQVNRAFANAIDDLREKFPMAEVRSFEDYDNYGRTYRTVKRIKAEFANGSYVTFNVGLDGTYRMADRKDAEIRRMDMMQTLEFFANQNK